MSRKDPIYPHILVGLATAPLVAIQVFSGRPGDIADAEEKRISQPREEHGERIFLTLRSKLGSLVYVSGVGTEKQKCAKSARRARGESAVKQEGALWTKKERSEAGRNEVARERATCENWWRA